MPSAPIELRRPSTFLFNSSTNRYQCKYCHSHKWCPLRKAVEHEESNAHVLRLREIDRPEPMTSPLIDTQDLPSMPNSPTSPTLPAPGLPEDRFDPDDFDAVEPRWSTIVGPALLDDDPDAMYDDWGGNTRAEMPLPPGFSSEANFQNILDRLEHGESAWESIYEDVESDSEIDPLEWEEANAARQNAEEGIAPDDNVRLRDPADWWPWPSEEECLMDVMSAFPRSLFSESEIEVARWFAERLGVARIPSVQQIKQHRRKILDVAGASPSVVEGKLGNVLSMLDIFTILRHEVANPLTRRHLRTYAEDTGETIAETFQAERWKMEIDANLAGPMARAADGQDYFVEEPALADIPGVGESLPVLITRWIIRDNENWATVHRLETNDDNTGFYIRGCECYDVKITSFKLSMPRLQVSHAHYNLPPPEQIIGVINADNSKGSWGKTCPNPWRAKAAGRRVLALPLWFYCDDTSGNQSKKWNKHNSILFTLAGLPREYVQMGYHIHFLSTSNLAPPLEMAEHLVDKLKEAQKNGVPAWDCLYDEEVLLLPWGHAFQGDNPMQSEFSSHIGMSGRHFCRVCDASGADAKSRAPGDAGHIDRVSEFMKAGKPRSKEGTETALKEQLAEALRGAPSNVDKLATKTGVKDKYFQYFFEKIAAACAQFKAAQADDLKPKGSAPLQEFLQQLRDTMPADLFNPILRISELDPHSDTPVEILHVFLLGFVKYWWRDAVSRQTAATKQILKARLASLDVSGLGLSRLRAHTLVQYAGSLTGRDFRIILQVAPAVLYGVIPAKHYDGWLTLCRLAPLIFQPVIVNMSDYLERLESTIADFLGATALWTTQWFNKPKFHVLLHILVHIRRYGPAILCATESFESYNLVIRLRSIHSSRHAPSVDISQDFSHLHAVRHLVSGGFVTDENGDRRCAGPGVLGLIDDVRFQGFMGMAALFKRPRYRQFTCLKDEPAVDWAETKTGKAGITPPPFAGQIIRCKHVFLSNDDKAYVTGFVLFRRGPPEPDLLSVGQILEILVESMTSRVLGLLLAQVEVGAPVFPYYFPSIAVSSEPPLFVPLSNVHFVVHTFHNCHRHNCVVTRTRVIVQERRETGSLTDEVLHTSAPDDLVWNLAQLHNAVHVQPFQPISRYPDPSLTFAALIEAAVKNRQELDAKALAPPNAPAVSRLTAPVATAPAVTTTESRPTRSAGSGERPPKRARRTTQGSVSARQRHVQEHPTPSDNFVHWPQT